MKKITTTFTLLLLSILMLNAQNIPALKFKSGDVVSIPNNNAYNIGLGDFTMELTINLKDEASGSVFHLFGDPVTFHFEYRQQLFTEGSLRLMFTSPFLTSKQFKLDGQCHHVAVKRENDLIYFYLDGELAMNGTYPALPLNISGIMNNVQIGGRETKGMINNVRFWNIARTDAEILANKEAILTGNETGLIGYWLLDEGTGIVASDRSSLSNDGSIVGPEWASSCLFECNIPNEEASSITREHDRIIFNWLGLDPSDNYILKFWELGTFPGEEFELPFTGSSATVLDLSSVYPNLDEPHFRFGTHYEYQLAKVCADGSLTAYSDIWTFNTGVCSLNTDFTVSPDGNHIECLDKDIFFVSTGNATTYNWSVDGIPSDEGFNKTFHHNFDSPGLHSIRLTTYSSSGNCAESKKIDFLVEDNMDCCNALTNASFTNWPTDNMLPCANTSVNFWATTASGTHSWLVNNVALGTDMNFNYNFPEGSLNKNVVTHILTDGACQKVAFKEFFVSFTYTAPIVLPSICPGDKNVAITLQNTYPRHEYEWTLPAGLTQSVWNWPYETLYIDAADNFTGGIITVVAKNLDHSHCIGNLAEATVDVSACAPLNRLGSDTKIADVSIYPNPSNSSFTLNFIEEPLSVTLYTDKGKIISEIPIAKSIEFGDRLEKGIYLLLITTKDSTLTEKIVKE